MTDAKIDEMKPEPPPIPYLLSVWTEGDRQLTIGNLVTIYVDSARIEYHEGYTPDGAAKTFWQAIAHNFPPLVKPGEGE